MTRTITPREFKAGCREPFAWPGGYPMALVMNDGETLCYQCARENAREILTEIHAVLASGSAAGDSGWIPAGWDVLLEGPAEICAHCGREIETAYGDPENNS